MSETITVGATVTWRSGGRPGPTGNIPLGVCNCRVLEIGEAEDGKPAAMVLLPPPFGPDPIGAYLADLYVEAR